MSTQPNKRKEESDLGVVNSYWNLYGGFKGLFKSAYFYMALFCSAIGYKFWTHPGWWDMPLSILPNMLGFSLAGFAIFLAFGNDSFRVFLVKTKIGNSSAFISLTATFMHFVMLQATSLLLALIAKFFASITVSLPTPLAAGLVICQKIFWLACFSMFLYSLTSSLASVIAIFRLVRIFDAYTRKVDGQ